MTSGDFQLKQLEHPRPALNPGTKLMQITKAFTEQSET